MTRSTRRSGLTLAGLGLLGLGFFWLTDPRYGPAVHRAAGGAGRVDWRHWLYVLRGSPDNVVEAVNQMRISSLVGVAGCGAVLAVGLWLSTRRTI